MRSLVRFCPPSAPAIYSGLRGSVHVPTGRTYVVSIEGGDLAVRTNSPSLGLVVIVFLWLIRVWTMVQFFRIRRAAA